MPVSVHWQRERDYERMDAHPSTCILLVLLVAAYWAWHANWASRIAIGVAIVVYLAVNSYFFDIVRNASTHGNTIHGWYSKYNRSEKFFAWLWFIGFPMIAGLAGLWVNGVFDRWRAKRRTEWDI